MDKSLWIGAVVVGLVVAYIEIGRQLGILVPIPFLILLGIVVLVASIGGKRSGTAGAVVASGYIFYSMLVNFGPATLTGGPVQVTLGIALMLVVGYFLGRTRDQNHSLIEALKEAHHDLDRRVTRRTAELTSLNEKLNQEIAERNQIEEALKANERYFRSLIENALDIVTVLNPDATIRYESPSIQRILGYEPEDLLGQNIFDYIHPDDIKRVAQKLKSWKNIPGRSKLLEFRFRHKDGSWRYLEAIGNNLLADPDVDGAIINSRDITQRRQIEKQAQRQEQLALVGQLAAGIAHDFNNVMAVILLYAQLLKMSPNLTAKEKKRLDIIYNEGNRAAELTTQILDFGRQSVLNREQINLAPFLQEVVGLLRRTLPDSIQIEYIHDDFAYFVSVDSARLQQAIMNLALNARDAMPGGGLMQIELEKIDHPPEEREQISDLGPYEWVCISVKDHGDGLSPEARNHLFEPFYTTKEPGKGSGLGLAQVYGIVKQHGGFLNVESEPGKGALFGITLPLESKSQAPMPDTIPHSIPKGSGQLILIVEDNNATRLALMAALESLDYRVKGVEDGNEALDLLNRYRQDIDLVISDIDMPVMNGIDLMNAMEDEGYSMPLILLTGNSVSDELARVKTEGRVEWHLKPISLEQLGIVVANNL